MLGYIDRRGWTILTGLPIPPPSFLNITDERQPGNYIFGHNKFLASDFHLIGIFRRKVAGSAEEFILGFLSVVLIAILSEIVHSFLMRTTRHGVPGVSERGLEAAYLVDEFYHFRNVFEHVTGSLSRSSSVARSAERRPKLLTSMAILTLAAVILSVDVVAVYLTQPAIVRSNAEDYNLRAVQPTGTNHGLSKFVRRVSIERTCVTPIITNAEQRRNFLISACILYEESNALTEPDQVSDNITVSSFYHRGGSDHNVTYGNSFHTIRTRGSLFFDSDDSVSVRLLFENLDDADFSHAQFLQEVMIHAAMEFTCNQDDADLTCQNLVDQLEVLDRSIVERNVVLWQGRRELITEDVMGLVTTFNISLKAPAFGVRAGLRVFGTSSVLQEVAEPGRYAAITDEKELTGMEGLLSEEGRIAGVVLLSATVGTLFAVLILLRCYLKPTSLARLAHHSSVMTLKRDVGSATRNPDQRIWEQEDITDSYFMGAGPSVTSRREPQVPPLGLEDYDSAALDFPPNTAYG